MIKRTADKLFRWFCHPDFYPDIKGDLEEIYKDRVDQKRNLTQVRYALDVFLLFRISLLRPIFKNSMIKDTGMFRNYFKISFRNLMKHKGYTAINVIGVAVGLAAFLLINQYIRFERSYDSFHKDPESIYRLTTDQVVDGQLGTRDAMSFNPSGKIITEEIPEVNAHTLTYNIGSQTIRKGESLINEESVKMADEHFINFFGHTVISGDPKTMLEEPNSIVLTESKARFYFGEEDAVGKTLHLYSSFDEDFKVTGVVRDIPLNTHFKFDMLISISSIKDVLEREGWNAFNYYTYLRIDDGTDIAMLEEKLIPIKNKYLNEGSSLFFNLQPIQDIHLNSSMTFEIEESGSKDAINFLEIISIFILVIAWVNYVNLSTAKAIDRAKEVGLRKVIGAGKKQLRMQFLVEAFLINVIGALVALIIAQIAAPAFNSLVDTPILGDLWKDLTFLKLLGLFTVVGTIISGFYPATFLSNFKIISVLKGKFRNSKSGVGLRKGLVVLQFATSIVLIACTLIVIRQVRYMKSMDKGMNTEQVVAFGNPETMPGDDDKYEEMMGVFKDRLLKESSITSVATSSIIPGGESDEIWSTSGGVKIVGLTDRLEATTYIQVVDNQYFELLDISFIDGRNFIKDNLLDDTTAVIVNQAFLDRFNLADQNVLNEKIQFGRDPENDKYNIIGVIKDANRTSLKKSTEPTCYFYDKVQINSLVKLSPKNVAIGLKKIDEIWSEMFPTATLEYSFIDDRFDRLYKEDRRFGAVFSVFSGFALLVAILGLFGLISFIASQRTKEVGVRKVLGASEPHIVGLFYREFIILIGVAALIGVPIVFFGMNSWLDNYAYRINFPWEVIIVAMVVVIICSLITVSARVLKVASLNPANTLKYE
ncbi:putative ABC transport system permease protein [Ekhidna lutea]|uniref:Putative ABC transport system permease protein n=1 Tax=Ekhidna lutea TaxID=447679 RepID=A0A239K2R0_EKHLU|nr:FtsX-like permease family protein [Ekhidna lutea]SNT12666.1 putative ABC transport system permease protein [Ekhidna lutea]